MLRPLYAAALRRPSFRQRNCTGTELGATATMLSNCDIRCQSGCLKAGSEVVTPKVALAAE